MTNTGWSPTLRRIGLIVGMRSDAGAGRFLHQPAEQIGGGRCAGRWSTRQDRGTEFDDEAVRKDQRSGLFGADRGTSRIGNRGRDLDRRLVRQPEAARRLEPPEGS